MAVPNIQAFRRVTGIWLGIVIYIILFILFLICLVSIIFCRWIYKNKVTKKRNALVNSYLAMRYKREDDELAAKKAELAKGAAAAKTPVAKKATTPQPWNKPQMYIQYLPFKGPEAEPSHHNIHTDESADGGTLNKINMTSQVHIADLLADSERTQSPSDKEVEVDQNPKSISDKKKKDGQDRYEAPPPEVKIVDNRKNNKRVYVEPTQESSKAALAQRPPKPVNSQKPPSETDVDRALKKKAEEEKRRRAAILADTSDLNKSDSDKDVATNDGSASQSSAAKSKVGGPFDMSDKPQAFPYFVFSAEETSKPKPPSSPDVTPRGDSPPSVSYVKQRMPWIQPSELAMKVPAGKTATPTKNQDDVKQDDVRQMLEKRKKRRDMKVENTQLDVTPPLEMKKRKAEQMKPKLSSLERFD